MLPPWPALLLLLWCGAGGYPQYGHVEGEGRQGPPHTGTTPGDIHGGVQMGVTNACDDAKSRLWLDWDNSTDYDWACQAGEPRPLLANPVAGEARPECLPRDQIPLPLHKCMSESIVYEDKPPTAGPHRPNWPVYGTYTYIPPQRWVHALEHGAIVLLHHPCADAGQVELLSLVVRACIRKHVITPYRDLPHDQPLAVLAYGCKLLMSRVNVEQVMQFIKDHGQQTDERHVSRDGEYSWGLKAHAQIVSDVDDSTLCPRMAKQLPQFENMATPFWPGDH